MQLNVRGFQILPNHLDRTAQEQMALDLRKVISAAPLSRYNTPYGKKMSVRMSAAGVYGWVADRSGYRYADAHPSGVPWPAIPQSILEVWQDISGVTRLPECCLINFYDPDARMSMHRDDTEADFAWPVVSISLGDDGLFRIGNAQRGGKTESVWLRSGDVVVMGGDARLTYHGVDRIKPGTSTLLDAPGRINLTLRVVT